MPSPWVGAQPVEQTAESAVSGTDAPAGPPPGPPAGESDEAAAAASRAVLERRRAGLRRSAADMVRTMAVVVGVVVVLVLLVPRPNEVTQPAADVPSAAQRASQRLGVPVAVPAGLPAGWTATSARVQTGTDGVLTWHVGYLTPAGQAAGVIQGAQPTAAWEGAQVIDGAQRGSTAIDGRTWVLRSRPDRGITNYVLRRPELTTIVTGRAPVADLTLLARSLDASLPD